VHVHLPAPGGWVAILARAARRRLGGEAASRAAGAVLSVILLPPLARLARGKPRGKARRHLYDKGGL